MLLRELVLENFGVYRGRQTLDLCPPSQDRPIVLFGGLNGAGKTTLLNGLHLVLYGKRASHVGRTRADYETYLRESIHRGAHQSDGASVEVHFDATYDGELGSFRVRRYWTVGPDDQVNDGLAVFHDGAKSTFITDHWDEVIEEIFPLEISSLFFFDGEKIEELADPYKAAHVTRTAIESLLGLSILDRLSLDLVALERRKRAVAVDESTRQELRELEDDLATVRDQLEAALQDQAACQNDIDRAERSLEQEREEFRKVGGEAYERRAEYERRRVEALERIAELESQLVEVAADSLPLRLVEELLERAMIQIGLESDAAESELLAKVLAERDEVVLARISEHIPGSVREQVEADLAQDRADREAKSTHPCFLQAPEAFSRRAAYLKPDGLDRLAAGAKELLAKRQELERQLEYADRQLAAVPSAELVAAAVERCEAAIGELAEAQGRHHVRTETVEIVEAKSRALEQRLERRYEAASASVAEGEDAERIIHHARRAHETVREFRAALLERSIGRIEAAVLVSLKDLLHKDRLISDLRIDADNFEVKLFDGEGEPLPTSLLSAGERQVLALSLLWGLAKVAGRRLPTVIDTPLGRLDSSHRQLIVERYFPNASQQVLLLSTDEEIDQDLFEKIQPAIGITYRLQHNEAGNWTQAIPGYFWETESNVA
jgi:DNA sulfur modification protein DndD